MKNGLPKVAGWFGMALVFSTGAHALPTRDEVYRNDDLAVTVYRDSEKADQYWFVPQVKLYEVDGAIQYRKRKLPNGDTAFTFYVLPTFGEAVRDFISQEIPGLHASSQLKPVYAKRFGVQSKWLGVSVESEEVTDYRYLNQPQMVRFVLNPDQTADFEDLFSTLPGVPVLTSISYESERVEKYLQIELTYKEVYKALNIGGTGRYTFTQAEIASGVSQYLANKYLNIRAKGDIKIPEIVNKVIESCFTPVARDAGAASRRGMFSQPGQVPGLTPTEEAELIEWSLREVAHGAREGLRGDIVIDDPVDDEDDTLPPPRPRLPAPSSGSAGGTGGIGGPLPPRPTSPTPGLPPYTPPSGGTPGAPGVPGVPGASGAPVQFRFKRELADRDEKFLFHQEQMVDTQEKVVLPAYLTSKNRSASGEADGTEVIALEPKAVRVTSGTARKSRPLSSGVRFERGSQVVLASAFSLHAANGYNSGQSLPYRWDPAWGDPEEELYFRVGNGPWLQFSKTAGSTGRALISATTLQRGEIQFYVDKSKLWQKIPAKLREPRWGGLVEAIFPFEGTTMEFGVTVTGRKLRPGH